MNNKLILRTLTSPFVTPYQDITKGSVLSQADVDNNFIYLKGETIYSAVTTDDLTTLKKLNGNDLSFPAGNSFPLNHIPTGKTVNVKVDQEYIIYGNLIIEGELNNEGKVVVINGNLILSGSGIFNNTGIYQNVVLITPATKFAIYNHIPFDNVVNVNEDEEYIVYGDLLIEGTLNNEGKVVIINGNLSLSGSGAFNNGGIYENVDLIDTFVTGLTYNNNVITLSQNQYQPELSILIDSMTGLTINGDLTVNGDTITNNLSATTVFVNGVDIETTLATKITKPAGADSGEYLYFNGIEWVPNILNTPVSAGAGVTLFLEASGSTLPSYEYLSTTPLPSAETIESVIVNNNTVEIDKYATNELGRTIIDGGIWEYNTFASADVLTGSTYILINTYLITTGSVETLLFTAATENITTSGVTLLTVSYVEGIYPCDPTDRLVVKYSAVTTNNVDTTVDFYHGGVDHYTHIHTPFITLHNDLKGLQGGLSGDYYHLTQSQTTLLTTGLDASSLHNHATTDLWVTGSTGISSLKAKNASGLDATGDYAIAEGYFTIASGSFSHAGGRSAIASGQTSFVHGSGSTAGGTNTIVLGAGIIGLAADTTYVDKFNIKRVGNTASVRNLGIDSSGNVVSGTSSTDTFVTGGTPNNAGKTYTFTNNTGGTFTVNALTDIVVTGGTYNAGTATYTNNTGGTFTVTGFFTGNTYGPFGVSNSGGSYTYYSTFTLAMSAATSGQTIEMFADVTETSAVTITIKNGVNIDGHNHTYTLNNTGATNAFDISANTFGSVAWSMKWSNMTVIRAGSSSGGTGDANAVCLYYSSNLLTVEGYIQFSGVLFKNTGSGCCVVSGGGPMMLDGLYLQLANSADCFYSNSIYSHLKRCNAVNTSSGRGIVLGGGGVGDYCYGESASGSGFYGGTLSFCKGYSASSGIGFNSPSNLYNCIGISSSSIGIYAINTVELINSIGISVSNYGIQAAGGSLYMKNNVGISSSSYGLRTSGDTPRILDCKGISTSGVGAYISHNGYTKVIGGHFQSLWNNAAGYGAFIGDISSVSKVTAETNNASAYNFYYSSPTSMKIYQNSYIGGLGVHSNITNSMINTEDNYGNIIE